MKIATAFLRSINLSSDLAQPARLAHFQPTSKSLRVLEAVAHGEPSAATMVIAAYGSGKSLAAGVGGLVVDNRPYTWSALTPILDRLQEVDRRAATRASRRCASDARGLVIALHGYTPDLASTLAKKAALKVQGERDLAAVLDALRQRAQGAGLDRIAIVWDEFGHHLEGLIADGRSPDLLLIQELAEWAVRQNAPRATLTLLLHQSLLNYASRLNQTARSAWRKIEGRFEIMRFIEDSSELYSLVGRLIVGARQSAAPSERVDRFTHEAYRSLELDWFGSFGSADALATNFANAWPVTPAALYVLPLLAARVAQNERSLFTFLNWVDLSRPVGLEQVYAYFADAMRSDTGLGGTHRRWLETESARSRADDALEREVLAAACLLQLGTGGERRRLPRAALLFAVAAGTENEVGVIETAIDRLLERKLLLHRLRNDDVSIWHGADIDIRARVDEEKARLQADFDLAAYVERECPPPFARPLRHNVERGIGRCWTGRYVVAGDLLKVGAGHPAFSVEPGEDGHILYAIAESGEEVSALAAFAGGGMPDDPGLALVVPNRPLEVTDAALELVSLTRLGEDQELIGADPLVLPELKELTAVAREHLHRILAQLTDPTRSAASWFARRQKIAVGDGQPLGEVLSRLADARFPKTPRILNEQVARHRLTRPMVNARKKAVLGALERGGAPALGFAGMTTPDASIYRTVLERTGIYRERDGAWRWAEPHELDDPGLAEIWAVMHAFFADPAGEPKPLAGLLDRLIGPPYGLRRGVLPILCAAALRAFGKAIAIRRDGVYLEDILASEIEDICAEPERFTVQVLAFDESTRAYLQGIILDFADRDAPRDEDLVRAAYDAIIAWRRQLPPAALTTRSLGDDVQPLQLALRTTKDPVELLFDHFPRIAGYGRHGPEALARISELRRRIDGLVEGYAAQAIDIIARTLSVPSNGGVDVLSRAKAWADCFANGAILADRLDLPSKGLLGRAREATNGRYTAASFARSLSAMVLGKGFEDWHDGTHREFADALRRYVDRIEQAALDTDRPSESITPVLEGRLRDLVAKLQVTLGPEATNSMLDRLKHREDAA